MPAEGQQDVQKQLSPDAQQANSNQSLHTFTEYRLCRHAQSKCCTRLADPGSPMQTCQIMRSNSVQMHSRPIPISLCTPSGYRSYADTPQSKCCARLITQVVPCNFARSCVPVHKQRSTHRFKVELLPDEQNNAAHTHVHCKPSPNDCWNAHGHGDRYILEQPCRATPVPAAAAVR